MVKAASSTNLVKGPTAVLMDYYPSIAALKKVWPLEVNLEDPGFNPTTPLKEAGHLIEPPISAPKAKGAILAAILAADPPELPPQDLELSWGFLAVPHKKFMVS